MISDKSWDHNSIQYGRETVVKYIIHDNLTRLRRQSCTVKRLTGVGIKKKRVSDSREDVGLFLEVKELGEWKIAEREKRRDEFNPKYEMRKLTRERSLKGVIRSPRVCGRLRVGTNLSRET